MCHELQDRSQVAQALSEGNGAVTQQGVHSFHANRISEVAYIGAVAAASMHRIRRKKDLPRKTGKLFDEDMQNVNRHHTRDLWLKIPVAQKTCDSLKRPVARKTCGSKSVGRYRGLAPTCIGIHIMKRGFCPVKLQNS